MASPALSATATFRDSERGHEGRDWWDLRGSGTEPLHCGETVEARFCPSVRKRKVAYPPPRNKKAPPAAPTVEPTYVRPTVVSINLNAGAGQVGFSVGDKVRIVGTGLYSGEAAVIESFAGGVIPSAVVRTEAGRTRRVRTIDLERIPAES